MLVIEGIDSEGATALHFGPNANTRFFSTLHVGGQRDLAKQGNGPSALHPLVVAVLGRELGAHQAIPAKEQS
jgi:hypothetical protein